MKDKQETNITQKKCISKGTIQMTDLEIEHVKTHQEIDIEIELEVGQQTDQTLVQQTGLMTEETNIIKRIDTREMIEIKNTGTGNTIGQTQGREVIAETMTDIDIKIMTEGTIEKAVKIHEVYLETDIKTDTRQMKDKENTTEEIDIVAIVQEVYQETENSIMTKTEIDQCPHLLDKA